MSIFGGPSFDPAENEFVKSEFNKQGGHYNIYRIKDERYGMEWLRQYFPEPTSPTEFAFVLFSTSGVHGSYTTIEDIENSLILYSDREFSEDESWPDDYCGNTLTVLVVEPRIVRTTYGNIEVAREDIAYLKGLRESSWKIVSTIGIKQPPNPQTISPITQAEIEEPQIMEADPSTLAQGSSPYPNTTDPAHF